VQESPIVLFSGQGRVSGANRVFQVRVVLVPRTSGPLDWLVQYDNGDGSGWRTAFRFTTSTAGQFLTALEASGISVTDAGTGIFFDSNRSGFTLDGNGGLQVRGRSASNASNGMEIRSSTAAGGATPIRLHANANGLTAATQAILEVGRNSAFSRILAIMGDGVIEAPRWHLDATVRTAGTFTAVLYTLHRVDLSGAAVTATLPEATAANAGAEIMIAQTVAGTGDLVLSPSAGSVEGAASLTIAGLASAPLRSVTLTGAGAAFGWKVARTT
jgi:hypothetical protein